MHFSVATPLVRTVRFNGRQIRGDMVNLRYVPGEDYRFSPVVSKRQGNAPARNRVKRIIRDVMHRNRDVFPTGWYLIYFNGRCDDANHEVLARDLGRLVRGLTVPQKRPRQDVMRHGDDRGTG